MHPHDRRFEVQVLGFGKTHDAPHFRESLKAKFTHKAGHPFIEYTERLRIMPYSPVVGISYKLMQGIAPPIAGRRGPIIHARVVLFHRLRQDLFKDRLIIFPKLVPLFLGKGILPSPTVPAFFIFYLNCFWFVAYSQSRS